MENLLPSCDQFCIFVQNLSELLKLTLNKLKIRIIFQERITAARTTQADKKPTKCISCALTLPGINPWLFKVFLISVIFIVS